ncbi:MAG: YmdB family metallophosphoesterase [Rickettsiaceae bacterium]|jgi:metallophosphoesterase (TIGR00282 family)|nr:YmdB family metallophosphoesterase [Rickettsiaceae bacterium]
MKILFCGDLVGKSGRKAVEKFVPKLKAELGLDLVIANVDNASGGFGINKNTCDELIACGVDVMTGGDHIWDQRETLSFISSQTNLLRPLNFPKHTPGNGAIIFTAKSGKKILVIHLLGQVFIKNHLNCPFEAVEELLKNHQLSPGKIDAIIVDIHAEATSEKMAMGKFLDGKVSLVVGTHTHIPTNDFHIMRAGTAYQTDAGMCGDYDSVIGMQEGVPLKFFLTKRKMGRMEPGNGEATFCATLVETDDKTGLAKKIEAIKLDGVLLNQSV